MRPKPAGLDASYAAQFNDPSVVAAYVTRPPYADGAVSLIADLAGGANGRILELGCGTGELARRVVSDVRSVTAIDRAERMIARARRLPGGDAPNLEWIVGRVEDIRPEEKFTLIVAAESFHWFDWDVLCPRLAHSAHSVPLVLMERCEVSSPWSGQLKALIAKFSTNRDFQAYDLVEELVARACYAVGGRRTSGPERFTQSIDAYVTSIHSRNGFSRDRMNHEAARQFDRAVRAVVAPHAMNDNLTLLIETRVVWGTCCSPDLIAENPTFSSQEASDF